MQSRLSFSDATASVVEVLSLGLEKGRDAFQSINKRQKLVEDYEERVGTLRDQVTQLGNALKLEKKEHEDRVETLQDRVDQLDSDLNKERGEHSETIAICDQLRDEAEAMRKTLAEKEACIEQLKANFEVARAKYDETETKSLIMQRAIIDCVGVIKKATVESGSDDLRMHFDL